MANDTAFNHADVALATLFVEFVRVAVVEIYAGVLAELDNVYEHEDMVLETYIIFRNIIFEIGFGVQKLVGRLSPRATAAAGFCEIHLVEQLALFRMYLVTFWSGAASPSISALQVLISGPLDKTYIFEHLIILYEVLDSESDLASAGVMEDSVAVFDVYTVSYADFGHGIDAFHDYDEVVSNSLANCNIIKVS